MGRFNNKNEEIQDEPKEELSSDGTTMPIWKFFQLHRPEVHMYHKAYLGAHYRGQLKTAREWSEEIQQHIKEK